MRPSGVVQMMMRQSRPQWTNTIISVKSGQGDEVAASILDTTARWVAVAVVTLRSLLDMELIVFGGSIVVRRELYERVQRALPDLFSRPITIAPSQLGDRAGLIGAAWAAGQALRQNPEL